MQPVTSRETQTYAASHKQRDTDICSQSQAERHRHMQPVTSRETDIRS